MFHRQAPRNIKILQLLDSVGSSRGARKMDNYYTMLRYRTRDGEDCGQVCRLILERCEFGINDIMYKNHALSFETRKIVGLGTPLHEAARAGRLETVQVLLEFGADLAVRDSDGCTVFDVAKNVGNEAVVQYLTRSCAIGSSL